MTTPPAHHLTKNQTPNISYLLEVSVAPRFTIGKYLRGDSAILVVLHAHRHGTSLDTCHMASRRIGDVNSVQTAARRPQSRSACVVVMDPQCELPVVVVNLFCAGDSIKVQRQQVSVVNLWEKRRGVRNTQFDRIKPTKGIGMSGINDREKLARRFSEVETYERSFNHTVIILYSSFKAFN